MSDLYRFFSGRNFAKCRETGDAWETANKAERWATRRCTFDSPSPSLWKLEQRFSVMIDFINSLQSFTWYSILLYNMYNTCSHLYQAITRMSHLSVTNRLPGFVDWADNASFGLRSELHANQPQPLSTLVLGLLVLIQSSYHRSVASSFHALLSISLTFHTPSLIWSHTIFTSIFCFYTPLNESYHSLALLANPNPSN
jgi:hypothetical protein